MHTRKPSKAAEHLPLDRQSRPRGDSGRCSKQEHSARELPLASLLPPSHAPHVPTGTHAPTLGPYLPAPLPQPGLVEASYPSPPPGLTQEEQSIIRVYQTNTPSVVNITNLRAMRVMSLMCARAQLGRRAHWGVGW